VEGEVEALGEEDLQASGAFRPFRRFRKLSRVRRSDPNRFATNPDHESPRATGPGDLTQPDQLTLRIVELPGESSTFSVPGLGNIRQVLLTRFTSAGAG
jgi:hypothetical protein